MTATSFLAGLAGRRAPPRRQHLGRHVRHAVGLAAHTQEERAMMAGDDLIITPEMIEAGRTALASYDPNDDDIHAVTSEEAARAVFVAMACVQREAEETTHRPSDMVFTRNALTSSDLELPRSPRARDLFLFLRLRPVRLMHQVFLRAEQACRRYSLSLERQLAHRNRRIARSSAHISDTRQPRCSPVSRARSARIPRASSARESGRGGGRNCS
jgi:hypothetical protein